MNAYEKFRAKIDSNHPMPTPATDSRVELEILRNMMTEQEAEFACHLSLQPETIETIAQRAAAPPDRLREVLESLVRKGVVFKVYEDVPRYSLVAMLPGIYEFQVGRMSPAMVRLFEQYYAEKLGRAVLSSKTSFSRIIPVNSAVRADLNILTCEEAQAIVERASLITLADCICRVNQRMIGRGCDAPADEICIIFDSWARYYAENGLGRIATKQEARDALQRADQAGLVHNTLNAQKGVLFICNCCGCCCGILRGITQLGIPTAVAKSGFIAAVKQDGCTGCGICVQRCHVSALAVENDRAVLREERCIGCGVCVAGCPTGAISLKRRDNAPELPQTAERMFMKIALERRRQQST